MDDIKTETPDLTLVKTESVPDQQLISIQQEPVKKEQITTDSVKDSDLILLRNNQALTTSLKIAESFEKRHGDVIRKIEQTISDLTKINQRNFTLVEDSFIKTVYKDQKGEERPVYYLNRDAFTLLVMGFTGEKALGWKIRYIDAFNRMEEELRRQQENKPMTSLEILQHQVAVMTDHENRLNSLEDTVQQQSADIKRLQQNSNSMFLRHEMSDIRQQGQLDQHETDIQRIQRLISDKGPREEIATLISDIVSKTANTESPFTHKEAYEVFYKYVREQKKIRLSTKLTNLKRLRAEQGWSKTKVNNLNCLDAIDSDPSIWGAIRDAVTELYRYLEVNVNG